MEGILIPLPTRTDVGELIEEINTLPRSFSSRSATADTVWTTKSDSFLSSAFSSRSRELSALICRFSSQRSERMPRRSSA